MVAQPTVSKRTRAETAFAHPHEDRWPSHSPQHSLTRQSTASSAAARKHERAPRAGSVRGPAAASNVLCGPVQTSAFGSRADGIAGRSDGEVYSTGRSTALQEVPGTCLDVGTQPPATDDGPKAMHAQPAVGVASLPRVRARGAPRGRAQRGKGWPLRQTSVGERRMAAPRAARRAPPSAPPPPLGAQLSYGATPCGGARGLGARSAACASAGLAKVEVRAGAHLS